MGFRPRRGAVASRHAAPLIVALVVLALAPVVMVQSAPTTSLDWSFCVGYPATTATIPFASSSSTGSAGGGIQAPADSQLSCPPSWRTRSPQCGRGAQAPISLYGASVPTDSNLRPFDLSWAPSRNTSIALLPQSSVFFVEPLDFLPALWDPNAEAAYGLYRVSFHSPSQHAIGGGRRDLEVQFVHRPRATAADRAAGIDVVATRPELVVSMLFDASPVKTDNEALWSLAYDVVMRGSTRISPTTSWPQTVDFAALAPARRDYVTYRASAAMPPCAVTTYVVMDDIGSVSLAQLNRIRAALNLTTDVTAIGGTPVAAAASAPPIGRSGNHRPLQYDPFPSGDAGPRRFVDFVGQAHYVAEPLPPALNLRAEDFAVAAVVLSCCAVVIALAAARLSRA